MKSRSKRPSAPAWAKLVAVLATIGVLWALTVVSLDDPALDTAGIAPGDSAPAVLVAKEELEELRVAGEAGSEDGGDLLLVRRVPDLYSSEPVAGEGLIERAVGDKGFWLANPERTRRVFILLSDDLDPSDVRPGESVWISGKAFQTEGLNPDTMKGLRPTIKSVLEEDVRVFVHVEQLVSLHPASTAGPRA